MQNNIEGSNCLICSLVKPLLKKGSKAAMNVVKKYKRYSNRTVKNQSFYASWSWEENAKRQITVYPQVGQLTQSPS